MKRALRRDIHNFAFRNSETALFVAMQSAAAAGRELVRQIPGTIHE